MVIIAHTNSVQDGETIRERPLIATKLVDELIAMVDIVGYLDVVKDGDTSKRIIRLNPADTRFDAKDRTGSLPEIVKPEYVWISTKIQASQKPTVAQATPKDTADIVFPVTVEEVQTTNEEIVQEAPKDIVQAQENPFDENLDRDIDEDIIA